MHDISHVHILQMCLYILYIFTFLTFDLYILNGNIPILYGLCQLLSGLNLKTQLLDRECPVPS